MVRVFSLDGYIGIYIFQDRYKRFVTPYEVRLIAISPCIPRLIRGVVKVRRHEAMWTMGINGCQRTPLSNELDGKELHGALGGKYNLKPRRSASFLYTISKSQYSSSEHLQIWYHAS